MNTVVFSSLLAVGTLHLLLELVLGVQDGVLSLHDVHFGHSTRGIFLRGDDAYLVSVVLELGDHFNDG